MKMLQTVVPRIMRCRGNAVEDREVEDDDEDQ